MKCYLCKNSTISELFTKSGYHLFKCSNCGLIFYKVQENYDDFLERQYGKGYFTGEEKLQSYFSYADDKPYIKRNMHRYLKQVEEYKNGGKLLDVGCAYGYLMEEASCMGFDVYGVDPSKHAAGKAAEKFKRKVQAATLNKAKFNKMQFDVITMFDVFEHLDNPRAELKRMHELLNDDGLVVIATGDTGCVMAKAMGKKWTFYNPPQHIFYFNQKNITRILKEEKFKVLKITKTGKWLSLRYVLHLASTVGESGMAKKIYPAIRNNILGAIPLYLRLNDNMVVFAKKYA